MQIKLLYTFDLSFYPGIDDALIRDLVACSIVEERSMVMVIIAEPIAYTMTHERLSPVGFAYVVATFAD